MFKGFRSGVAGDQPQDDDGPCLEKIDKDR